MWWDGISKGKTQMEQNGSIPDVNSDWEMNSLRAALRRKTWGFLWVRGWTWPTLTAHKPSIILGWPKQCGQRARERILPCSILRLMRPHLGYCIQLWGCQHMKNMGLLEQVQRRTLKMIRGMERLFNENRLRQLGLFQPGEDSLILWLTTGSFF